MSSADWWARRLGAPAPPREAPVATQPRSQPAPVGWEQSAHAVAADAAHDFGNCPECGSDSYFAARSETSRLNRMAAAPRCFDCGYPVRHTTSGMGSPRGTGTSTPSKQGGDSGYHPDVIVGRLG